jgi:oligosaccharide repeat unit polymerase
MLVRSTQQRHGGTRKSGMPLLLAGSLLFASISATQIMDGQRPHAWAGSLVFAVAMWLALFLAAGYSRFRTVYTYANAYIVTLLVFHFGLIAQYAIGLRTAPEWSGELGRWIYLGGWTTLLAVSCFGIGHAAYALRGAGSARPSALSSAATAERNLSRLRNLGYGLAVASLVLLILAIAQLGNLLKFTRFDLFYRAADTRGIGVFTMVCPAAVAILVLTARTRSERIASYVAGFIATVVLLLSGSRSIVFFPLLAGIVTWTKLGRKIPTPLAVTIAVSMLAAAPAIGYLRTIGPYERLTLSDIAESKHEINFSNAFAEMGSSIRVVAVTLESIPSTEPFRMGRSYLQHLVHAFPNIGSTIDSGDSRSEMLRRVRSNRDERLNMLPSDWATLMLIPGAFMQGSGTGFSAVAEPYFNFGYLGVCVFFLLLGAFFARLDSVPIALHYEWLVFATILLSHLLVTVRNEFGVFIKPTVFTLIILAIWIAVRRFPPFSILGRRRLPGSSIR